MTSYSPLSAAEKDYQGVGPSLPALGSEPPFPSADLMSGEIAAAPSAGPPPPAPGLPSQEEISLSEPVWTTLWRDMKQVGLKMSFVFAPRKSRIQSELRQWDLWGCLLTTLSLATILSLSAPPSQATLLFSSVFVITWAGSSVVTLNGMLLGGRMSFFQVAVRVGAVGESALLHLSHSISFFSPCAAVFAAVPQLVRLLPDPSRDGSARRDTVHARNVFGEHCFSCHQGHCSPRRPRMGHVR